MPIKCREDKVLYLREYYQKNRERCDAQATAYRERLKLECVAAYGGACSYCGIDDPIVLVIDHVYDNAKEDRKARNHSGGWKMYIRLRQLNYPRGEYQLLCHNCNYRKEHLRRKRRAQQVGEASKIYGSGQP